MNYFVIAGSTRWIILDQRVSDIKSLSIFTFLGILGNWQERRDSEAGTTYNVT